MLTMQDIDIISKHKKQFSKPLKIAMELTQAGIPKSKWEDNKEFLTMAKQLQAIKRQGLESYFWQFYNIIFKEA